MIHTSIRGSSGAELIAENPELVDLHLEEGVIITSPDIDVKVTAGTDPFIFIGGLNHPINKFLGRSYQGGEAIGLELWEGKFVDIEWFPSPSYVNKLTAVLGMVAGQDVLKFVHASEHDDKGKTPAKRIVSHVAIGEYPQSTFLGRMFGHDRNDDHTPGVILMPTPITRRLIPISGEIETAGDPEAIVDMASVIDRLTFTIGRYVPLAEELRTIRHKTPDDLSPKQLTNELLGLHEYFINDLDMGSDNRQKLMNSVIGFDFQQRMKHRNVQNHLFVQVFDRLEELRQGVEELHSINI